MIDLDKLNSATKYPSIETYHKLGERGRLTEEAMPFEGGVILTEKVDGTNGRIILMPDGDYYIGSRENLLYAKGDRVFNEILGIVRTLQPLAERIAQFRGYGDILVLFLEVYGVVSGRKVTPASTQYTSEGNGGCRLFDLAMVPTDTLTQPREDIAAWRDAGGQKWATESDLLRTADSNNIPLVPRIATVSASELPQDVEGMHKFLDEWAHATKVALDNQEQPGAAEGIVLRTYDRKAIAKARFEDYERTLRRR